MLLVLWQVYDCLDIYLIIGNYYRFVGDLKVKSQYLAIYRFQEGTLKQINKDRNKKTTRNIQEGLPFTIEYVKQQTNNDKSHRHSKLHLAFSLINFNLL